MPASREAQPGLPYPDLLLPVRGPWWRLVAAILFGIFAAIFVGSLITQLVISVAFPQVTPAVKSLQGVGPWVVGAFLIPLALPLIYRVSAWFITSVELRIRWRTLFTSMAFGLVVVALAFAVSVFSGSFEFGRGPDASNIVAAMALVIFLVPLQCAGEEVLFRGLFAQVLSTRIRARWAVALITSLLFSLAHGGFTVMRLSSLLVAALLLWLLMWLSGGLEASVAMHTTNNWISYGLPLFLVEVAGGAASSVAVEAVLKIGFTLLAFGAAWLGVRVTRPARVVPGE